MERLSSMSKEDPLLFQLSLGPALSMKSEDPVLGAAASRLEAMKGLL